MDQKQIDPGETWRTYHGTSKLIQKTRVVRMFGLKRRRCPKPEFNVTYSLSLKHHSALGDSPVLLQWLNTVELVFDLIVSKRLFFWKANSLTLQRFSYIQCYTLGLSTLVKSQFGHVWPVTYPTILSSCFLTSACSTCSSFIFFSNRARCFSNRL